MIERNCWPALISFQSTRKWGDLVGRPNNIDADGDLLSDFDRL